MQFSAEPLISVNCRQLVGQQLKLRKDGRLLQMRDLFEEHCALVKGRVVHMSEVTSPAHEADILRDEHSNSLRAELVQEVLHVCNNAALIEGFEQSSVIGLHIAIENTRLELEQLDVLLKAVGHGPDFFFLVALQLIAQDKAPHVRVSEHANEALSVVDAQTKLVGFILGQ